MAVDRDQVEPAIIIDIEEAGSPFHITQGWQSDSGLIRDIVKIPFPVIAVKRAVLVSKVGHVYGRMAGMQIVPDSDAHGPLLQAIFADGSP